MFSTSSPDNSRNKEDSSQIKGNSSVNKKQKHLFFVILNSEGCELMWLRKMFVEQNKIIISNILLLHPGFSSLEMEIDYKKYSTE